jgi:hypothetical protein
MSKRPQPKRAKKRTALVELLVESLEPRHSAQWAQILDTLTRTIETVKKTDAERMGVNPRPKKRLKK